MIRFQFSAQDSLVSRIIQYSGAGLYSHVDLLADDGQLYGARSDRVGGKPPGVQMRPPGYAQWARTLVLSLQCTDQEHEKFWAFAMEQEGKPYDKQDILGFIFNRDWRDPSAWFCSELAAAATEASGRCPRLVTPKNKIQPVCWATVVSALGGV